MVQMKSDSVVQQVTERVTSWCIPKGLPRVDELFNLDPNGVHILIISKQVRREQQLAFI
jgi:hypothetical protein